MGYTYQQYITYLLIVKMDVERIFKSIDIETITESKFDDARIKTSTQEYEIQIKDIDNISIDSLRVVDNQIFISNKPHKLSKNTNILFFKEIELEHNDNIFGFPAYKIADKDIYIISLSRSDADNEIQKLYINSSKRNEKINQFFQTTLDLRITCIELKDLPKIDIYKTTLQERTIDIQKHLQDFENVLFVEGKPGVGKSHLVTNLQKELKNILLYRFWISNQDKDNLDRLVYQNFLSNISKELTNDQISRTDDEIIELINQHQKTFIIDGLDHIENNNDKELDKYIQFIDKLNGKCKVIVFSRPLKKQIDWTKQLLGNWNFVETRILLKELYAIEDYDVQQQIYSITDGYPILVRYLAEHFLQHNEIPNLDKINDINEYYQQILKNVDSIHALTVFLSTRAYLMDSELDLFLEDELLIIIKDIISTHRYLFEIKLNRISLFHDSLNTFLRLEKIKHQTRSTKVKKIVYNSIMNRENRFLSRAALFELNSEMWIGIINKYASIDLFNTLLKECIDFEALRSFYTQLRTALVSIEPNAIPLNCYYELSLIIIILQRDHLSTLNGFLYTYVKSLQFHGYTEENISSSDELWAMLYYIKTGDKTLLYDFTSENNFDTRFFDVELKNDIDNEENHFVQHYKPLRKTQAIKRLLNDELIPDYDKLLSHILANLYLHETSINEFKSLQDAIKCYLNIDQQEGINSLKLALKNFKSIAPELASYYLSQAKEIILSTGSDLFPNYYHEITLEELITNNRYQGSFNLRELALNYIRLALHEKRKIDIKSIGIFNAMYGMQKDTTVINIPEALKVFEDCSLIAIENSISIISFTQSMSEKGIRHIMNDYIMLHDPEKIMKFFVRNPEKYRVSWFALSEKHIDRFSDKLFSYAINKYIFTYSSFHSKEIKYKDIQYILKSNRREELIDDLEFRRFHISIPENHPDLKELEEIYYDVRTYQDEDDSKYYKTSEQRYHNGILDSSSIDFIREQNLRPDEIAGYTNGNYAIFADLNIFSVFSKEDICSRLNEIMLNTVTGKIKSFPSFANLYYVVGNFPKFIFEYGNKEDMESIFKSFIKFLEISLLYPTQNTNIND
ncbi:MAG: hypothetical protein RIS29_2831 [Bacteroidota bacterium]